MNAAALTIQETPPAAVATVRAEGQSPEWDAARKLLDGHHATLRTSATSRFFVGAELAQIKEELGFTKRGGDRRSNAQSAHMVRTWPEHCQVELGISRDSADRLIAYYHATLKALNHEPDAARLLSMQPSKLEQTDQDRLMQIVRSHVEGKSMKEILDDFPRAERKVLTLEDQAKGGKATAKKHREKLNAPLPPDTLESHLRMLYNDLAEILKRAENLPERQYFKDGLKQFALCDDPAGSVGIMDFRKKLESLTPSLIAAINQVLRPIDQTIEAQMSAAVKKPRKPRKPSTSPI
jgi:hypothetical protein